MKTFSEAINEAKVSFDGMTFAVNIYNDRNRGMVMQFIPDGKTLDNHSKNEQVDVILKRIGKTLPTLDGIVWYESGNLHDAGLSFRFDTLKFASMIEKAIK